MTRSTRKEIHIEICSACHPFFTGKLKYIDTAGRIEKFQNKFAAGTYNSVRKPADKTKKKVLRRDFDFASNRQVERLAYPFVVDEKGEKVVNVKAFDLIWPNLRVLARCDPEDKLILVTGLKQSKLYLRDANIPAQVVAVTGVCFSPLFYTPTNNITGWNQ